MGKECLDEIKYTAKKGYYCKSKTVNGLESEIARATDKNEALLKVIQKGDIIAKKVLEIVNNII